MASVSSFAAKPNYKYITIDSDAVEASQKSLSGNTEKAASNGGITVLKIAEDQIENLSEMMHHDFNRCGGFMLHESKEEAMKTLNADDMRAFAEKSAFADYTISQGALVKNYMSQVEAHSIKTVIQKLSSFQNRYYKSKHGVASQEWLYSHWSDLAKNRSDVKVEKFKHKRFPQPTVILTIEGNSPEVIVVGGHADSISGYWGREKARAPGADDNASGTATTTEVIRVLMNNSFKPEKTIKFMAYAAEEVGLLGSAEIAKKMRDENVNVIGVMQLDMTNFQGSDLDIVMMTDFTNKDQNAFVGKLLDTYLPEISWGYDKCGYGCSDHASWNRQGFPASMPFESKKAHMNHHIHTSRDTLENSQPDALHAYKFAKMAVAFVIELDR
jgi:leucyl aminopeptidase